MTDPLQEPIPEPLSGGDEEFEDQPLEAEEEDAEQPEGEDQDDAAADAAASEEGEDGPSATKKAAPSASAKVVALDPQARDGLIRCLQARIKELDATLAHANEVAQKDTFYSRWPNVVIELRSQALKRLEELQRS
jgi:hypothetical protein